MTPDTGVMQDAVVATWMDDSGVSSEDASTMTVRGCAADCPPGLCDEATGTCAPCLDSSACTEAPLSQCVAGDCVECGASEDCAEGLQCLRAEQRCVECLSNDDCSRPEAARCEDNVCVRCQEHADCGPDAPICGDRGQCTSCKDSEACSRFDALPACDTNTGACVECTADDNQACCGRTDAPCCADDDPDCQRFVCDVQRQVCSNVYPRSATVCDTCVADEQCEAGQRCVLQSYENTLGGEQVEVGWVCLQERAANTGCVMAPYISAEHLPTTDNGVATVCNLGSTTCQALRDYSVVDCAPEGMPDASLCGYEGAADSVCHQFESTSEGAIFRCSPRCLSDADCAGKSCVREVPFRCGF